MASSSTSVKTYDVFISFRGTDTRKGITSFLYDALCDKGIKVFIDEEDLNKGDEISSALVEAIKTSAISIIVFSENYAQSRWCLDELNHIVRCMKEDKQRVLPVFYKVDPRNIRHQKRSFEDAFSEHETDFGRDSEKLKIWRESLRTAANLSGFNSAEARSESEMIKRIVESVMEKLKDIPYTSSYDTNGLVGKIKGHTLYFFENVREEVTKQQSSDLQKRVFLELLKEKDLKHVTPRQKDWLLQKNVLLVLDDVDNAKQLDLLAIDRECFSPAMEDANSSFVRSGSKIYRRPPTTSSSQSQVRHCFCGVERVQRTAWTDLNPGRRFVCCYKRKEEDGCAYWEWVDPEICERSKQIIPGLLRRLNQ